MADGFGTVTFGVMVARPPDTAQAEYTVTHIPYGNSNYIDWSGPLPTEMQCSLKLASENDYQTLRTYLLSGSAQTLTVNGTAYLSSLIVRLQRTWAGPNAITADAVFLVP